mmetsp:Transcript_50798/g.115543  ORF Transcript_50798/g.115543 Transcript_50798/m.115543 type:complete len:253 (-) Transcript_50798:1015-1773(-)
MVSWTSLSVSLSTEAVASSMNSNLGFFTNTRARHSSWAVPADRFSPFSFTSKSNPFSHCLAWPSSWACRRASQSSASVLLPSTSIFERMVPLKSQQSWGITPMRPRRVARGIEAMLIPSSSIDPPATSTIRKHVSTIELFPLPVRPTIPTFSPAPTSMDTPFSTLGRWAWYLISTLLSTRLPLVGQLASGSTATRPWASVGRSLYSAMRWQAAIMVSTLAVIKITIGAWKDSKEQYARITPAVPGVTISVKG